MCPMWPQVRRGLERSRRLTQAIAVTTLGTNEALLLRRADVPGSLGDGPCHAVDAAGEVALAAPVAAEHGPDDGEGEGDEEPDGEHLEDGRQVQRVGRVVVLGDLRDEGPRRGEGLDGRKGGMAGRGMAAESSLFFEACDEDRSKEPTYQVEAEDDAHDDGGEEQHGQQHGALPLAVHLGPEPSRHTRLTQGEGPSSGCR